MQKAQSSVEFAFIVPFLVFLFLALVYGGLLFIDYIQYNNAARAIARAAAFENKIVFDDTDKIAFEKRFSPLTSLYSPKISDLKKSPDGLSVTVSIELTRSLDLRLFHFSYSDNLDFEFPPKHLKSIVYTMPIENSPLTD